jgi:Domain of unknown function (DUF3560)
MTNEEIEKIRAARIERAQRRAGRRMKWAESAEKKAEQARATADNLASVIPFGQPILVGHHSERRDRTYRNQIDRNYRKESGELSKAEYHKQKAENILKYGSRVAGDAERAREAKREAADQSITVGSIVKDAVFGQGEVLKVNKKTYTVRFSPTLTCARDKSYFIK